MLSAKKNPLSVSRLRYSKSMEKIHYANTNLKNIGVPVLISGKNTSEQGK